MEQFGVLNINLILLTLGGLVLGLGLMSGILKEKLFLTNPIIAMLVGVLFGPAVLDWLNLDAWGSPEGVLKEAARIAIAIQVMGVALRLPPRYLFNHPRPVSIQLGVIMPLMWLVSGGLAAWLLGLSFWNALLVGAIITPTDPVVSTSIVTGQLAKQCLPHRIRNLISAESAINDGLAYPFVLLPILFLTRSPQEAFWHWLTHALIVEVGLAIVLGALMGYVGGRLLHWAEDRGTIDRQSFLAYTVALALFVLGSTEILGSDSILAVFVAGIAFDNTTNASERAQEEKVQDAFTLASVGWVSAA
ncbi:MAG: cation:proton antiporter [Elainellaceae cyanobacterium]